MKIIFSLLSTVVAVVMAQGGGGGGDYYNGHHIVPSPIPIIHADAHHNLDGSYGFKFETGNGIVANEQGFIKNPGVKDGEVQVAHGSYSYTGPDGVPVSLKYVADENGFHAAGSHLPTPPPLPRELAEAYAKAAETHAHAHAQAQGPYEPEEVEYQNHHGGYSQY